MRRPGKLAVLAFALVICAVAVWRIGRGLVAPEGRAVTVVSLLGAASPAERPRPDGRDVLPEPDDAAVARARARLRTEPLSAAAYAVLALAAEKAGQDERADRLMRIAAAWWPRDLLVQTWLLARGLRRGDVREAMSHLDTALRTHPEALDDLTEAMSHLLIVPAARAALVERLAEHPPWRSHFIGVALRQWSEPQGLVDLLDALQAAPSGLSAEELRPFLTRLLASGRIDEAYAAWLRGLSPEAQARLAFLYNGDFGTPPTQMPFDWRTPTVAGVTTAWGEAGGRPVLSVGFLGGRVSGPPVLHEMVLAPGAYRLSGRVRTDRLRSERGIRWRIACLAEANGALGLSETFAGTASWRDFTLDFTVPEDGCPAQILGLEADARTAAEAQVSGVASFSALDIVALDEREDASPPIPPVRPPCPPVSKAGRGAGC